MEETGILLSEESLFREDSVFNPDYLPDQFNFRDSQLKELTFAIRPAMRGGKPGNTFILGPPATGKTTAVKLVFNEVKKETSRVLTVHINCHMFSTAYKIFSEIHRLVFGLAPPETGIPLSKVREDVFTRLAKDKKTLIVALDDINYLFEKNTVNDILYMILRAHEAFKGVVTSVFAVATEEVLHNLDDRVRSVFSPVRVNFPKYSSKEVFEILKKRCELGLYPSVMPDELLEKITFNSRDLRFGIELIRHVVITAESDASKSVTGKHLEKSLTSMSEQTDNDSSSKLLTIIRSRAPIESGELFKMVKENPDLERISYTTFYRILQKLHKNETIEIELVSKQRGKTSVIRPR